MKLRRTILAIPALVASIAQADITASQTTVLTDTSVNSSLLKINDHHHFLNIDLTGAAQSDTYRFTSSTDAGLLTQTVSASASASPGALHNQFSATYSFDPGGPYGTIDNSIESMSLSQFGAATLIGGTGTYTSNISFDLDGSLLRSWSSTTGALDSTVGGSAKMVADIYVYDIALKDGLPVVLATLAKIVSVSRQPPQATTL